MVLTLPRCGSVVVSPKEGGGKTEGKYVGHQSHMALL